MAVAHREGALWWRLHFEDNPLCRTDAQISARIDGVERYLGLEHRSRVIDLGCGSGRPTLELSRRGHRVLGMDPVEEPLTSARAAAREEKLNAHFVVSDIRQISYRGEFDAAVSLFSSFGRFPLERDDVRTLESVHKSLKTGGKLLLDLVNREWLVRHVEPEIWDQAEESADGVTIQDQISFDLESGRLDNLRSTLDKDGNRTPSFMSVRVYTLTEIKKLVAAAGLVFRRAWGAFDGSAYGLDSYRMIVMAEKPVTETAPRKEEAASMTIRIKGRRR
ncbi:MAG: class I SAM-dependent methyltransferase [Elusimicrobia bacterium]|nr:class I SAM-dependent methyltransferase [Elusimicrobiota bacterium]